MFIHWDNCNSIHEGSNYINIRRTHTVLCMPLLPWTPMVWLGNCSIFKKWTTKENRLKITTSQKYLVSSLLKGTWICDTVFRKTTSLEYSGKNYFFMMKLGTNFNISFSTVPIEALVHPLCVIPDCSGDSDIYFVVLPKRNRSQFFGQRTIITANI